MKSIIIGTAGRYRSRKDSLVKALTGIDADRLEEGTCDITIDLGFAHLGTQRPQLGNDKAARPTTRRAACNRNRTSAKRRQSEAVWSAATQMKK